MKFLKPSLAAILLSAGMMGASGCDLNINQRRGRTVVVEPAQEQVIYAPAASEPPVVYHQEQPSGYWVHGGRVYERDQPGNFYLFEGQRRGPRIEGSITIDIQRKGRHFKDYREADRNRHGDQRPQRGQDNRRR